MSTTQFTIDKSRLTVRRTFTAPAELVWRCWTEAELLDKWWAPRPWKSETSYMDFREGGHRIYDMVGPEGQRHGARTNYASIAQHTHFTGSDAFLDENGNVVEDMPVATFVVNFIGKTGETEVVMITDYPSEEQLETVIKMGMREGLSLAFEHLDELLAKGQ